MTPTLQLMRFHPVSAYEEDRRNGTTKRLLFYRAVSVQAVDDHGMTILAHAAQAGDARAIALLLERGANPNAMDRYGLTPLLHLAQGPRGWRQHPEDIEKATAALLRAGASLLPKDSAGRTAAFRAVDALMSPFFVACDQCGMKLTGRMADTGYTLLHALCATLHRFRSQPLDDELEALLIASILVNRFAVDIEAKSAIGKTAREIAVENGSRIVAPWLKYGNSLFAKDETGKQKRATGGVTATEAAAMRSVEKMRALIALGRADDCPAVDGKYQGYTPLSCAALFLAPDVIDLLIENGADPTACINRKSVDGKDVQATSALRALLWAPLYRTQIPENAKVSDWVRALRSMVPNARAANATLDPEGRTPLLTLAQNVGRRLRVGDRLWTDVATPILLMKGADPNQALPNAGITSPFQALPGGITPLGVLVRRGSVAAEDMARLLLEAGADPNRADRFGMTPLMQACQLTSSAQAESFVTLLLDAGALTLTKNQEGLTALDYVAKSGHDRVMAILLAAIENEEKMVAKESIRSTTTPVQETRAQTIEKEDTVVQTDKESISSMEKDTRASVSDFFARMRAKTQSLVTREKKNFSQRTNTTSVPKPMSSEGMTPHTVGQSSPRATSFFARMQEKSQHASVEKKSIGRKANGSPIAVDSKDPFGAVRGMQDFLDAILSPLQRTPREIQLLALGLYAEGGAQDPSILARRTADLCIALGLAVEVDWKTAAEDFCALLEGLQNYAPIRASGFRTIPLDVRERDDVPSYVRAFDKVCEDWGFPVRLAEIHIDGDSYVLMLLEPLVRDKAYQAAKRAQLSFYTAKQIQ